MVVDAFKRSALDSVFLEDPGIPRGAVELAASTRLSKLPTKSVLPTATPDDQDIRLPTPLPQDPEGAAIPGTLPECRDVPGAIESVAAEFEAPRRASSRAKPRRWRCASLDVPRIVQAVRHFCGVLMESRGDGETATRVYRARKTVLEMLTDRGYYVPKAGNPPTACGNSVARQESWLTLEQFLELHGTDIRREVLTQVFHKPEDHADQVPTCRITWARPCAQIFVYFAEDQKVGVATVKSLYEKMKSENARRAVMIIHGKLSPFVRSAIANMEGEYHVEVFQEQELLINITKHVLVPEHRVLTPGEKQDLMRQYKLKEGQLPRIQLTDPVARYYGMTRGQVVRIIRPSETAGRYVTYRIGT